MSTIAQEFKVEHLTRDQKLQLIDKLWASLAQEENAPVGLTPEQLEDLHARIEYRRQNPEKGSTWEEVRARVTGRA